MATLVLLSVNSSTNLDSKPTLHLIHETINHLLNKVRFRAFSPFSYLCKALTEGDTAESSSPRKEISAFSSFSFKNRACICSNQKFYLLKVKGLFYLNRGSIHSSYCQHCLYHSHLICQQTLARRSASLSLHASKPEPTGQHAFARTSVRLCLHINQPLFRI